MPQRIPGDNEVVNGLWIGNTLSLVELLTLHSFTAAGHRFRLWTYGLPETPLPPGVELCDAATVIPRDEIFSYRSASSLQHGKGSYAGFSDIFRYKLLYDHGGWWTDMDVACLRYLDFPGPYFFRRHHALPLVGNVMKCPKGSPLMARAYEEARQRVTAGNTDWHLPISILADAVAAMGLSKYICKEAVSNHDIWASETARFVWGAAKIPASYYFLHWQNEVWRHQGLDKNRIRYTSTLGRLLRAHGLLPAALPWRARVQDRLYHLPLARNLRLLGVFE